MFIVHHALLHESPWGGREQVKCTPPVSPRTREKSRSSSSPLSFVQLNKNRLCSMTCGIDKIYKIDRLNRKRSFIEGSKRSFKWKEEIPPRREIWSGSNRSWSIPTDPTPKRNLVREQQILINPDGSHPEGNFGWDLKRILDSQKSWPWHLDLVQLVYL